MKAFIQVEDRMCAQSLRGYSLETCEHEGNFLSSEISLFLGIFGKWWGEVIEVCEENYMIDVESF